MRCYRPPRHQENMHRRHVAARRRAFCRSPPAVAGKRCEKTTRKERRRRRKETAKIRRGRARRRPKGGTEGGRKGEGEEKETVRKGERRRRREQRSLTRSRTVWSDGERRQRGSNRLSGDHPGGGYDPEKLGGDVAIRPDAGAERNETTGPRGCGRNVKRPRRRRPTRRRER